MGPLLWLALIALGWWWGRKDRPRPASRGSFPRCVPEVRGAHQDTQLLPFARPRWMDDV